jgi:outer membrane protein TolC
MRIESDRTGRARGLRGTTGAGLALLLGACQSYAPAPLDEAGHRARWHGRSLEDASFAGLLAELDREPNGAPTAFDPRDGLTLDEGRRVALVLNPELRLARMQVAGALAGAEHAGRLEDPELAADLLRVTESVPDRWVVSPSLAFSIPLSGRADAVRALADAEHRVAVERALEVEWGVWHAVSRAWGEWSAASLRATETARFAASLAALVDTTARLAANGELARTEAALFAVEQAQQQNRLRRLQGEVAAAEQRLRAALGLTPEASIELVASLTLAADAPITIDELAARSPALARLRAEYQVTEQALRRAVAEQLPALTLGPAYESDAGQSRVGLVAGIPLPILNANRRAIAEARADREVARVAWEAGYESLVGRWSAASALAAALSEQRADLEQVLVPLVERQLADVLHLMNLGEGTSLVLLESLTRAHQTRLDLIDTRLAEALARAELEHLTGPEQEETR